MKQRLDQLQSQNLKQLQRLILSPQMQQALHLLQLPVMELASVINEELEQNPLLECDDEEGERLEILRELEEAFREPKSVASREEEDLSSIVENTIAYENSLFELLLSQAKETFTCAEELALAELLIGHLDEHGFLNTPLEEIAQLNGCSVEKLTAILEEIQMFDPPGVGARHLQESLLIQLRLMGKEKTLAFRIIDEHFDEVVHNRIPMIAKRLRQSNGEIRDAIEREIARLELHPGANQSMGHYRQIVQHITPDVTISPLDDGFTIEVNEHHIPQLRLNTGYLRMLEDDSLPRETRDYIQEKISSGKWLLRNIQERHSTLFRIAGQIVKTQAEFFKAPHGKLSPLTMKEIAESLGLHESTIARAVANKYLFSSRGMLPLRSFFTNAYQLEDGKSVSSTTVKEMVKEIVSAEDRHTPLSDETISAMIKERGIPCARRTVAKYRQELNIGNTTQRKIF